MVPWFTTAFPSSPPLEITALASVWVTTSLVPSASVPGGQNAPEAWSVPPRDNGVLRAMVPVVTMFSTPSSVT